VRYPVTAYVTQLWATPRDLDELGVTYEALASKTVQQKIRALRAASGIIASYARSRYKPPLGVVVEASSTSGFDAGSVEITGTPAEAIALAVRVRSGGGAVGTAIPIEWSFDGGQTYEDADRGTLALDGVFPAGGLVLTFTGTLAEGDEVRVEGGVDWGVRQHVVSIGGFNLLFNRGGDPDTPDGAALKNRFDIAMAWAKDLQTEEAKLDEKADATPGRRETRARGGGDKSAWAFLERRCRR
jgi:hypothetical protein